MLDAAPQIPFDKVHVAAYSPRPGTIAHRTLPDDVSDEVKQHRLQAIEILEARISTEINQAFVSGAPPHVVEKWRARLAEAEEALRRLEAEPASA